jgi:hypothetical protein
VLVDVILRSRPNSPHSQRKSIQCETWLTSTHRTPASPRAAESKPILAISIAYSAR